MFGWTAAELPLLLTLPVLLVLSGFFSGAETALFSLSQNERMVLRRRAPFRSRAVETLLAQPRMLLISILLGNMTVNVLYFVINSVLIMRATDTVGVLGDLVLGVVSLLLIVLVGEVIPKLLASGGRVTFAGFVSPPLRIFNDLLGPLRITLNRLVVTPLERLTAPSTPPPRLHQSELESLLAVAGDEGLIDPDERRVLTDVLALGRLRVRDVMTPRVRIVAVPTTARRPEVLAVARQTRFTKVPVYGEDLDHVVGLLHIKSFLLDERSERETVSAFVTPATFVPEFASLEQLLDHFRGSRTPIAVVVDEYGGTAGIVAIEDVVEEIVGDIVGDDEPAPHVMLIGIECWRVSGDLPLRDWAEAFSEVEEQPRISTVGGLIASTLGRVPVVGDAVTIGEMHLTVDAVDGSRVRWITARREHDAGSDEGEAS